MKLKTSFFNKTLFMKNLTRFAPAWVLYGLFMLLIVGSSVLTDTDFYLANNLSSLTMAFSAINVCYAFLVGQLLFGDLFQSRMCNALHALPIRREGWFLTHLASALAFSLIPNTVFSLLLFAGLGKYWAAALLWLTAATLQYIFFFGVACISALLVGNRFAMLVVYGIINFFSGIVLWLVMELYIPHLYGVELDYEPFLMFCPTIYFFNFEWFEAGKTAPILQLTNGWGYLGICTAVGLGLMGLALLLYRKRNLEKAADFIAFPPAAPVFLVMYTFCAGTALHMFCNIFLSEESILFLIIGLAIGFFTGRMLLDRTIRVFRWKTALRFAILLTVFGLTVLLTILDPIGFTRWVPEPEQVVKVDIYTSAQYRTARNEEYGLTDQQSIVDVLSIHQYAVDHPEMANNGEPDVKLTFDYTMADGSVKTRTLYVDTATVAGQSLVRLLSRPECIFGTRFTTVDSIVDRLESIRFYGEKEEHLIYDRKDLRSLVEAILADCEMGTMAQANALRNAYQNWEWIYLEGKRMELPNGVITNSAWDIFFTVDCTNITNWMIQHGYK